MSDDIESMSLFLHKLEPSWGEVLEEEFEKPYMQTLREFAAQERASNISVYPPEQEVFHAFNLTPRAKVKVVIIGQDPYHGPGQAHGLCFSVQKGVKIPPSLQNIFKELNQDLGMPTPTHGCLTSWAEQGVLLLNATLTVKEGSPLSHHGRGWEKFTDAVIQVLCKSTTPIVFLLWGKSAQKKCEHLICNPSHLVLKAVHPSPLSAWQGFLGCRHFSQANQFLLDHGQSPIDWGIR